MIKRIVFALVSLLALIGSVFLFSQAATATPGNGALHSYVCKYVGTPGEDERLQTGQNPIWVSNASLLGGKPGPVSVGDEFPDAQGRSVVVVANTPRLDPEPGVEVCKPPVTPPPTTAPPTTTPPTTEPPVTTAPPTTTEPPVDEAPEPPAEDVSAPVITELPKTGGSLPLALSGILAIIAGSAAVAATRQ